jgi:hypothetical protein
MPQIDKTKKKKLLPIKVSKKKTKKTKISPVEYYNCLLTKAQND